jgi:caffeic acid 3-O-methyltransferase
MTNHRYYMKDAVAEGATPTEKAYGMPLVEHLASDEVSSTGLCASLKSHV